MANNDYTVISGAIKKMRISLDTMTSELCGKLDGRVTSVTTITSGMPDGVVERRSLNDIHGNAIMFVDAIFDRVERDIAHFNIVPKSAVEEEANKEKVE
jgi:hypothetical protein